MSQDFEELFFNRGYQDAIFIILKLTHIFA